MGYEVIFFTSDLHCGHKRLAEMRGFSSVEVMEEEIAFRWNGLITDKDIVYVLGDVSMCGLKRTVDFLGRLRGRKILIKGNHDRDISMKAAFAECFESMHDRLEIKIDDVEAPQGQRRIILDHYPLLTWNRIHFGAWHLHGHSHGSLDHSLKGKRLDVGIDVWGRPITYMHVQAAMRKKEEGYCDHHAPKEGDEGC